LFFTLKAWDETAGEMPWLHEEWEEFKMGKGITLVLAVWHIIIGGYIIFINGDRWCIACGNTILTGMAVVSVVLGLIGIVVGLKGAPATAGRQ
jgi:hypothetical protein